VSVPSTDAKNPVNQMTVPQDFALFPRVHPAVTRDGGSAGGR